MKALILILLTLPMLIQAQDSIDKWLYSNPYKQYGGELFTHYDNGFIGDGVWIDIPEEKTLNIQPSNTYYPPAERLTIEAPAKHGNITIPDARIQTYISLLSLVLATMAYLFRVSGIRFWLNL